MSNLKKTAPKLSGQALATKQAAAHATAIYELLALIPNGLVDCTTATWCDVGSAERARALLAEAAFLLGQIDVAGAEKHGASL
jgi:hypothetical protein